MEKLKPKPYRKRAFFGLTRLIAILFATLIFAITSSFVYWSYQSIHQELDGIEREIVRATSDASSTFLKSSTFAKTEQSDSSTDLIPIRFLSHPSPFSARDVLNFKKQYELKTYISSDDLNSKIDVLAGYSNVVMSGGLKGDEYLSIIIWVNEPEYKLYKHLSSNRVESNHAWLNYHSDENNLQSIFISLQALPSESQYAKPGDRIGEISGFVAPSYGETSSLSLDSSFKGSILKGYDNSGIVLTFRIRLDSPSKVNRPNVDKTRPIGLNVVLGKENKSISTFQMRRGIMEANRHVHGDNLQKTFESLQEEIIGIELVEPDGRKTSFLERPGTNTESKSIVEMFIKYMLAWIIENDDAYSKLTIHHRKNGTLVLHFSEFIQTAALSNAASKLNIIYDSSNRIETLVDNHRYQLLSYTALTSFIFVILIIIHLYVVKRLVRLSLFLAGYQNGTKNRHDIPLGGINDEIAVLSEFLESSIKNAELEKVESDQRYKRRGELMAIMGHDIRTPIAAIMTIHRDNPETMLYAKRIERASNTILEVGTLDNEILSGKNIERIDVGEFVQSLSDELKSRFNGRVEYRKPDSELTILTNAEILEDAVDGIIDNAIDFSDHISFHVSFHDKVIRIAIRNNGEAIDESVLETIFDYGVSKRKEIDKSHHGIGLFSSALRVNILGGTISAKNNKDGVAFLITLPLVQTN